MSKGERNLRLHIMVTHEELAAIRERMAEVNSQNQSAFIRKLAADGYAVNALKNDTLELFDISKYNISISVKRRCLHGIFNSERGRGKMGNYCSYGKLLLLGRTNTRSDKKGKSMAYSSQYRKT